LLHVKSYKPSLLKASPEDANRPSTLSNII
jgi:hypothetical protein